DSDSTDGNWRDALKNMNDLPAHPSVLLASRVADDYLLQEVVRNHGYDLLPKSAPSEKLIHCINFAWFWARAKANREDLSRRRLVNRRAYSASKTHRCGEAT